MIYIRTDANEQIATGHMMRCRTIAYELNRLGKSVIFLVSDSDSTKLLEDGEFSFKILNTRWDDLGTTEELKIMKTVLLQSRESEKEIPILFVDSYYVDNNYFCTLKKYAKIIFFDDLAADIYDVDVLINYNVTFEKYDYHNRYRNRSTNLILGPAYVPLRRQFREVGRERKDYDEKDMLSILVICGGSDSENVLYSILDCLKQEECLGTYYYNVVVGKYNPNISAIMKIATGFSNVNILYNISDMADTMKKCDIAITAASTVLYECCAVGLPAVFYTVADNQEPDAEVFSKKYGLIYVGDFRKCRERVLKNVVNAIKDLSSDISLRKAMSVKMQNIVDGKGSKRIANLMARLFETGSFFEEENDEYGELPVIADDFGGGLKLWIDGRTAISAVLEQLEIDYGRKKVCLLPEYTCDTVILPFVKYNYEIHLYRIRKDMSIDIRWFKECLYRYMPDVVLLHAYYGSDQLVNVYDILKEYKKSKWTTVIEDLTQSLFLYYTAACRADFVVCSIRKWFAVPDGGFSLKVNEMIQTQEIRKVTCENETYIKQKRLAQRLKLLYLRGEEIEKQHFLNLNLRAEQMLYDRNDLCSISENTKMILCHMDLCRKAEQRKKNAEFLFKELKNLNIKTAIELCDNVIPLYLPIYVNDREIVQQKLKENNIYAPILWPIPEQILYDVSEECEYIYDHLLALPCDHRYDERDMQNIIIILKDL